MIRLKPFTKLNKGTGDVCPSDVLRLLVMALSYALIAACSNEIDRRDELGVEGEGRSEIVRLKIDQETAQGRGQEDNGELPVSPDSRTIRVESAALFSDTAEEVRPAESVPSEDVVMPEDAQLIRYDPKGTFTVQIAGYLDAAKAQALVGQLRDSGYPAYSIAKPDGREVRVRIGYFKTGEEAESFGRRFQADLEMEYWVDKRENE